MAKGWVSIHREIQNHWLWEDKPFTKGQAWIDILMLVNHTDKKIQLGNEVITVERGSRITSIRQLGERWEWSRTKVSSFLKALQDDEMLIVKSDTKKTLITVENYSFYQDAEKQEKPPKSRQSAAEVPPKSTNNNEYNLNNNSSSEKFSPDSTEFLLSSRLRDGIRRNFPNAKLPSDNEMHKWAVHIDRMIRLDKRKSEEIKRVIDFALQDSFWQQNILSTEKLRKQFDTLSIRLDSTNKTQKCNEERVEW